MNWRYNFHKLRCASVCVSYCCNKVVLFREQVCRYHVSSSRLMLVCAQVSSFTKEMDFYITTDYLNSVILKTRSLLWELRGSRSGMAGDSVLFTHNPGWLGNRNSTSKQCTIIFLPNVRIRLPNHVAESSLSLCVTCCSHFLCLFIPLPIH
jgi:hypothetical protein